MSMSETTALRSSTRGCSTWRRLNASSWPVSDAARAAALRISSAWRRMRSSLETLDQELAVARDRRQEVVEVVGDAPGEATHGFHLLRLPQLRLELRRPRQVAHDGDVPSWAHIGGRDELDLARAAVRPPQADLRFPRPVAQEAPPQLGHALFTEQIVDAQLGRFFVRDAEQLSGRLVQIDESAFVVGHEHRHDGMLERRCEEQVRLALGGDVLDVGHDVRRRAVVPAHERDRQVSPEHGSVLAHVALLALIRVALAGPKLLDRLQVDWRCRRCASRHAR